MSIEDGELCQANSGALRFQVQSLTGFAYLALCSINPPHRELFKIFLARNSRIEHVQAVNDSHEPVSTEFIDFTMQHQEFWMTWFNEEIRVGFGEQTKPFMSCKYVRADNEMIGYVKFNKKHFTGLTRSDHVTDWIYEASPVELYPSEHKKINNGDLRWVTLINHHLPSDALIGGFEKEPTYIARAGHNGSMCPGKYVPSQRLAYIPWGGREHKKTEFEILCGYNATWERTSGNRIPQNAFIGGTSEVRREPLYIGRAVYDGNLINGKIHVIYRTCYLPYMGAEIEVYSFEILVLPDANYRGTLADVDCEI